MSALALMGLLPKDAEIASGSLCFQGEDLVTMKPEKRRQLCGSKMAMGFQEPMTSLNPVLAGRGKPADPYETRKC